MDAMQKRRMWRVTIIHLALSVFAIWKLMPHLLTDFLGSYEPSWRHFWRDVFCSLQPQFFVANKLNIFILSWACVILIPIWSICFGWLFVKFDNWLNHFPILGRKVF